MKSNWVTCRCELKSGWWLRNPEHSHREHINESIEET